MDMPGDLAAARCQVRFKAGQIGQNDACTFGKHLPRFGQLYTAAGSFKQLGFKRFFKQVKLAA